MRYQKQESTKKTIGGRIILSITIVVFSLVLLFFVFQTAKSINLIVRGKVGRAYCSRVERSTSYRNGTTSYQYFVELSLPNGIVYESRVTPIGSMWHGAAAEVLYDPVFPSLMELNHPYSLGIYPGLFAFIIGTVVWVCGVPFKRSKKKRPDRRWKTKPPVVVDTEAVQERKESLRKRKVRLRKQD